MGNSAWPIRVTHTFVQNLGEMIDRDAQIQVKCQKCQRYKRFAKDDLIALAEKCGRDYSLINRRCRCRLTPGCDGFNRFFYLLGVYRPLWDEDGPGARM